MLLPFVLSISLVYIGPSLFHIHIKISVSQAPVGSALGHQETLKPTSGSYSFRPPYNFALLGIAAQNIMCSIQIKIMQHQKPPLLDFFNFMTTVKQVIEQKANTLFSVRSADSVENVLMLMRDHRVRAILVIDDGNLVGIVSQGDCAIKVLLPHNNPKQVTVSKIMTANPLTVMPSNSLEECMAIMVHKHIRHLPVMENNKVVGVISVGDLVKSIIELQGSQIKFLETYINGHGV
jgi:CBS domain-containing protein